MVAGDNDVTALDPASAYQSPEFFINRAITRALFANVATNDNGGQKLVPDIAAEIPTEANGEISKDGLTYTIHLKQGIVFHTSGKPQAVVAGDIVRGLERMCNPVSPSPALSYFTSTIVGFQAYCDGFSKVAPTVDAIRTYVNTAPLAGVKALNDSTLQIKIMQRASDFISILGLGVFASPQPASYLNYLPDSPGLRQHLEATGPYMIQTYVPNRSYKLVRNPDWKKSTDSVREANVNAIDVQLGQDPATVQQELEAGTVDMEWPDTTVPVANVDTLTATHDKRLVVAATGGIRPYVVINTVSPNDNKAMQNVAVRQALNVATDKSAIQKILGGSKLATITNQILPPQVPGYTKINPLKTVPSGNSARSKSMLKAAGYPNGANVTLMFRNDQDWPDMAAALQQSLTKGGFTVTMKQVSASDFYTKYLQNISGTAAGEWDIALAAWGPDYFGGRSYLVPMLDGRDYTPGSVNFGDFNNSAFNAQLDAALSASTASTANEHWAKADSIASEQAAWVPVANSSTAVFHSSRVKGFTFLTWLGNGDPTNVSLK